MIKHKAQRVAVFIDVQNMYYSAKNLYGDFVNFGQILNTAVAGRQLIRAFAYVIKAEIEAEKKFFEALERFGFEVKSKDLQIFPGGMKKGDWDVGIAMDAVILSEKVDVIVLVTGDGDYVPLVEYLKNTKGCRLEVIAFGKTTSSRLLDSCDEFTDLDKNLNKFLISPKKQKSSHVQSSA
ncbi:MAG: NYN domain-containing protein [Patescibacteria group bacterium]|nr:NYN domain-containing protein [Patescibacteria group bacterium]